MRLTVGVIVLTYLILLSYCQAAEKPTLESYKDKYEAQVQVIRNENADNLSKLLDGYGRLLDAAIVKLKAQGDPTLVVRALTEKKRFETERTVPSEVSDNLPKELREAQAMYQKAREAAEVTKGKKYAALAKRYLDALDKLMRQYTNDGELDAALKVKAEKEGVAFRLADVAGQLKLAREKSHPSLSHGLVLHFDFNSDNARQEKDKSGKGNHGAVMGATRVKNGTSEDALRFDGKDDCVVISSSPSLTWTSSFTLSAWVNWASFSTQGRNGFDAVIAKRQPLGSRNAWDWALYRNPQNEGRDLRFGFRLAGQPAKHEELIVPVPSLETGKWYHLVGVYSRETGQLKLFLNAKTMGTKRSHMLVGTSDGSIAIGRKGAEVTNHFHGLLDNVMIWNRALSDFEVKMVYKQTGVR